MTPTIKATALANLTRMGFSADHAIHICEQWISYQQAFSLHSVTAAGATAHRLYCSGMDIDVGGQFFMSCHYGSYAHIIAAIAQRARDKTIYVLIGSEGQELKATLEQRAQEYGVTIHFLDGGFGMVKRVKRALEEHYPVFVEIDVPWGQTAECNVEFPFVGGQIKGKDALFRLIERLGAPKNFVLSTVGQNSITINNYGNLSQEECFAVFADVVRNCPQQYERLFQMHKYFVPAERSDVTVVWQGLRDQYVLHASDMKAWATPHALPPGEQQRSGIENLIGRRVSHVVPI